MLRSNLLFIHVVSAMGVFAALGMEALTLAQLRRTADGAAARTTLVALGLSQRVAGPAMLLLLLSGFYLATAYWQWQGAWIGLGLAGLVSIGAIGGLMTGRRVSRLRKDLQSAGTYGSLLEARPTLWTSFVLRAALVLGVVFLMTVKPGPVGSLTAFGAAILAGILVSATGRRPVLVESGARQ